MLNCDVKIPFPCPKCGEQIEESIARLEENPTLTCPRCGTSIQIEAEDLRRNLKQVEDALEKFRRDIGHL